MVPLLFLRHHIIIPAQLILFPVFFYSLETDLENLKRKVDAGADIIITQLFFDNNHYYEFVRKVRNIGIDIPIIPGLMPILSAKQILKITTMCGTNFPDNLRNKLENSADNDAYAEELGIKQCIKQVKDLLENGAPGIHFLCTQ